jgi:glycerophosphoryl diester phosphodiesterase
MHYSVQFLVILFMFLCCVSEQQNSFENRPVKVIAHRGMHGQYPENTIGAVKAAIEYNLDYVEVDVRTTKDGYLVLMHDKTIDRTTNHSGEVKELTLAQIKDADVTGNANDEPMEERIPSFREALQLMSGKIGVYVDIKDADAKSVLDALESYGMMDHSVIYSNDTQLSEIRDINPGAKIMPEVDNIEDLNRVMYNLQPQIVAMSWYGFSEQLIAEIHQRNVVVFLDILGAGDNPDGAKKAIAAGVDGIQSDNPKMVLQVLAAEIKRSSSHTQHGSGKNES